MNEETYQSWSRTTSFLLKLVGILGILFCLVFWALTNRIELAFLPFFGTLAGVGQGLDVLQALQQGRIDPPQTVEPAPSRGELPPSREEEEPTRADVPTRKPPPTAPRGYDDDP